MTFDAQNKLLQAIETMDVNPISKAIKDVQAVSRSNPGKISAEVDQAEAAANDAIGKLLEAQRALTAAVGRVVVEKHRNRPRAADEVARAS